MNRNQSNLIGECILSDIRLHDPIDWGKKMIRRNIRNLRSCGIKSLKEAVCAHQSPVTGGAFKVNLILIEG